MASELICETCGLSVPPDTAVCPRDGTVMLTSFQVPPPPPAEPKVIVRASASSPAPASPAAADPKDPLIGLRLGEYELRSRVGVGGMGLVYEGIQPLIGKRVAVKVLRPELAHSTEQVERLLAEARAVNAIRHRGIIDIFGFGQVPDGRQYIIMEFLDGQALDTVLAEKTRLPVQEALSILDEVLAALAAAHGAGVVHRDLKPSNIFLVRQPDGSRYVKVLDFGLAKRAQTPTGRSAQTRTDMVVGTPEYMAPEQARGQEVGPMTDLYALGVVTFEMVTGRLPFVGTSPVDLLMKHVEARPPRPSEFLPELPPALDAFILQMLTKDPETRPNSADALRQQLNKLRRTLRATRTNPSAPAPSEKPRKVDDVDSRRPTTPVPVPPEVQQPALAAQPPRAMGLSSPAGRRMAVAGGLGAAVLLLAAGTALIARNSGGTGTPAPTQPAGPASAGAAAPGVGTASATGTAAGTPLAAGTASATDTPGAPPAVGTTDAALAAGAASAPGTSAGPGTTPAPGTPGTASAAGTTSTSAGLGTAPAAGTPGTMAAQAAGTGTPGTGTAAQTDPATAGTVADSTPTRGDTKPRARIKQTREPEDSDPEESGDLGNVARLSALQRRIDDLEQELSTRSVAEEISEADTGTAQRMLDKYRREARQSPSAAQRKKISAGLDYLERTYLK